MAHKSVEYALGLMRPATVPVSQEARELPTGAALRARMAAITAKPEADLTDAEVRALRRYYAGLAHIRRVSVIDQSCSIADPVGGAIGARAPKGERFVEPRRRLPTDMQAGRVKARRAPEWN